MTRNGFGGSPLDTVSYPKCVYWSDNYPNPPTSHSGPENVRGLNKEKLRGRLHNNDVFNKKQEQHEF